MGNDKQRAIKSKWRIKENTLFLTALLGGMIGYYLGMKFFHHKTTKTKFYVVFYFSLICHVSLILFIFFKIHL